MVPVFEETTTVDAILVKIQQWDGWIAIQKGAAKEYGMSEQEFYAILPEYQKFMGLIALGYRGIGMWSQKVDLIWHAHILNTQRYENFCQTIIGGMVHHVPCCDMKRLEPDALRADPDDPDPEPGPSCREPEPEPSCREEPGPSCKEAHLSTSLRGNGGGQRSSLEDESSAAKFSALYVKVYGHIPPSDIWDFTGVDARTM